MHHGRERAILVDTLGLLLSTSIHPADVRDRDGGLLVLPEARRLIYLPPDGALDRVSGM